MPYRAVGTGEQGAIAHPSDFDSSVNAISTRGSDYAHHITTGHIWFSDLPTALHGVNLDRLSPASPIYVEKKINFRLQSRHDLLRGLSFYEIVLNCSDTFATQCHDTFN